MASSLDEQVQRVTLFIFSGQWRNTGTFETCSSYKFTISSKLWWGEKKKL